MEITYRRDSEHNYMIIKAPEGIQGDEYPIRMLLVNEIPGLLKCRMRNIDGGAWFYYEITSRQPLARVFEHRPAGHEDVDAIAAALGKIMEALARYLMADGALMLEPELIYMDVETREVSFCYLPSSDHDIAESFRALAEYLLKKLDHEDERAVFRGYQLYSRTTEANYSVRAAIQSMHGRHEDKSIGYAASGAEAAVSVSGDRSSEQPKEKLPEPAVHKQEESRKSPVRTMITGQESLELRKKRIWAVCVAAATVCLLAAGAALTAFHILTLTQAGGLLFLAAGAGYYFLAGNREKKAKNKEKKCGKANIRPKKRKHGQKEKQEIMRQNSEKTPEAAEPKAQYEEDVCEFTEEGEEEIYGQTTLLREETDGGGAVLISSNPDLRGNTVVDGEKFVIGKLKGQVDLTLNLPMISRIHAGIERREGRYFLVDMNSTNGTFLNGERLEANEYRQIHPGDEINFAGAGYYFTLRP